MKKLLKWKGKKKILDVFMSKISVDEKKITLKKVFITEKSILLVKICNIVCSTPDQLFGLNFIMLVDSRCTNIADEWKKVCCFIKLESKSILIRFSFFTRIKMKAS